MINPDQHHRKSCGGGGDPWAFLLLMAVPSQHHAPGTDMRQVDGEIWELYSAAPVAWHSGLVDAQKKPRR